MSVFSARCTLDTFGPKSSAASCWASSSVHSPRPNSRKRVCTAAFSAAMKSSSVPSTSHNSMSKRGISHLRK